MITTLYACLWCICKVYILTRGEITCVCNMARSVCVVLVVLILFCGVQITGAQCDLESEGDRYTNIHIYIVDFVVNHTFL